MAFQNVEQQAQAVWSATTVEAKREAFKQMLDSSRITAVKKAKYLAELNSWSATKLDKSASNFMLFDTDSVIK